MFVPLVGALCLFASSCTSGQPAADADVAPELDAEFDAKKDEPPPVLIRVDAEDPGANCAEGGSAIWTGPDNNFNGLLDPPEERTVAYVCNGADGAAGADGEDGAPGAPGEPGADGNSGQSSLISTSRFTSHADCPAGGVLIQSGIDDDGDETLEADEVDDEVAICDGRSGCGTSGVLDGDVTVSNLAEASAVLGCTEITGAFTLQATATSLSFPALTTVGGALTISGGGGTLSFPALTSVGGALNVSANPTLTSLAFTALTTVSGNVTISSNPLLSALSLSALSTVTGASFSITNNSQLNECELVDLEAQLLDGGFAGTFTESGNKDELCLGEAVICDGDRTVLSLPIAADLESCTEVTGNVLINLAAPQSVTLSALRKVGGSFIVAGFMDTLSVANLTEVTGTLSLAGVRTQTADFPKLTTVGAALALSGSGPVTAGELTSVGADIIVGAGISLTAGKLATGGGSLSTGDASTANLTALQTLPGTVQVGTSAVLQLDALTSFTGDLTVGQSATFNAAALTTFPGRTEFLDGSTVSAPLATSVVGSLFVQSSVNATLTALQSVGNRLQIGYSTLVLPAFTTANEVRMYATSGSGTGSLTAGAVTSLATLQIWSDATVSMAQLTSLTTLQVSPSVAAVNLPLVTTIGSLDVLGFDVHSTTFTLSAIEQIGTINVDSGATNLNSALATLQQTTGDFVFNGSTAPTQPAVAAFSLPVLTSIGGKFDFTHMPTTVIDAPQLASIGAATIISNNSYLTSFNLGALTSVAGDVEIQNNPALDQCDIDGVGANLLANGYSGTFTVANNSGQVCTGDCTTAGDLTIESQADVTTLNTCSSIEGSVTIAANFSGTISAPTLSSIGGNLDQLGTSSVLDFPALQSVGGQLQLSGGGLETLSSLTSVSGDITLADNAMVSFPAMTSHSGNITLGTAAQLIAVQLSSIGVTLTTGIFSELSLDALQTVGGNLDLGRAMITTLPALTGISGELVVSTDSYFSAPLLASVGGDMTVLGNITLDLPLFTTLNGRLNFGASTATLSALASIGALEISHFSSTAAQLTLPALTSVGEITVSGQATLTANTLTQASNILIANGVSTINLTGLQTLTGRLRVGFSADGSQFALGSLVTVGSVDADAPASNLPTAFTALTTVNGDLRFEANGNANQASVASLSMPQLATVTGSFNLLDHGNLTSFSAPNFNSLGGSFTVTGNASLSDCDVNTVQTQLTGNGYSGTITVTDTVSCD